MVVQRSYDLRLRSIISETKRVSTGWQGRLLLGRFSWKAASCSVVSSSSVRGEDRAGRMSPKAIFAARPGTFKFSDRVVDLEVKDIVVKMLLPDKVQYKPICSLTSFPAFIQVPCKIGRAFKNDKSESTNGYFDCKVRRMMT